ncbi:uncharacterized protein SCHCODRAFT_0112426 [Schizophyllum commune H4-8]
MMSKGSIRWLKLVLHRRPGGLVVFSFRPPPPTRSLCPHQPTHPLAPAPSPTHPPAPAPDRGGRWRAVEVEGGEGARGRWEKPEGGGSEDELRRSRPSSVDDSWLELESSSTLWAGLDRPSFIDELAGLDRLRRAGGTRPLHRRAALELVDEMTRWLDSTVYRRASRLELVLYRRGAPVESSSIDALADSSSSSSKRCGTRPLHRRLGVDFVHRRAGGLRPSTRRWTSSFDEAAGWTRLVLYRRGGFARPLHHLRRVLGWTPRLPSASWLDLVRPYIIHAPVDLDSSSSIKATSWWPDFVVLPSTSWLDSSFLHRRPGGLRQSYIDALVDSSPSIDALAGLVPLHRRRGAGGLVFDELVAGFVIAGLAGPSTSAEARRVHRRPGGARPSVDAPVDSSPSIDEPADSSSSTSWGGLVRPSTTPRRSSTSTDEIAELVPLHRRALGWTSSSFIDEVAGWTRPASINGCLGLVFLHRRARRSSSVLYRRLGMDSTSSGGEAGLVLLPSTSWAGLVPIHAEAASWTSSLTTPCWTSISIVDEVAGLVRPSSIDAPADFVFPLHRLGGWTRPPPSTSWLNSTSVDDALGWTRPQSTRRRAGFVLLRRPGGLVFHHRRAGVELVRPSSATRWGGLARLPLTRLGRTSSVDALLDSTSIDEAARLESLVLHRRRDGSLDSSSLHRRPRLDSTASSTTLGRTRPPLSTEAAGWTRPPLSTRWWLDSSSLPPSTSWLELDFLNRRRDGGTSSSLHRRARLAGHCPPPIVDELDSTFIDELAGWTSSSVDALGGTRSTSIDAPAARLVLFIDDELASPPPSTRRMDSTSSSSSTSRWTRLPPSPRWRVLHRRGGWSSSSCIAELEELVLHLSLTSCEARLRRRAADFVLLLSTTAGWSSRDSLDSIDEPVDGLDAVFDAPVDSSFLFIGAPRVGPPSTTLEAGLVLPLSTRRRSSSVRRRLARLDLSFISIDSGVRLNSTFSTSWGGLVSDSLVPLRRLGWTRLPPSTRWLDFVLHPPTP